MEIRIRHRQGIEHPGRRAGARPRARSKAVRRYPCDEGGAAPSKVDPGKEYLRRRVTEAHPRSSPSPWSAGRS